MVSIRKIANSLTLPFDLHTPRTEWLSPQQREKILRLVLKNFFLQREKEGLIKQQNRLLQACVTVYQKLLSSQRIQNAFRQSSNRSHRQLANQMQRMAADYQREWQIQTHFNQEKEAEVMGLSQEFAGIRQEMEAIQASQQRQDLSVKDLVKDVDQLALGNVQQTQKLTKLRLESTQLAKDFKNTAHAVQQLQGHFSQMNSTLDQCADVKQMADAVQEVQKDTQSLEKDIETLEQIQQQQKCDVQEWMHQSQKIQAADAELTSLMEVVEREEQTPQAEEDLLIAEESLTKSSTPSEPSMEAPAFEPLHHLFKWVFTHLTIFDSLSNDLISQVMAVGIRCCTELAQTFQSK